MNKGDEGNIRDKGDTGNKIAEVRRMTRVKRVSMLHVIHHFTNEMSNGYNDTIGVV